MVDRTPEARNDVQSLPGFAFSDACSGPGGYLSVWLIPIPVCHSATSEAKREEILSAVDYVHWINLPAAPVALRLRCACIPRPTGCAGESKTMFFMTRSEGRYVFTSRERGKSRWRRSRPPQYTPH